MARPFFTLAVVASKDGFIARHPGHSPQEWASEEEQVLFFSEVAAADWAIMGRGTHQAADRPDRRRIVFSSLGGGWRRPTQLWLDPAETSPAALTDLVGHIHPLQRGLILGGTRVHDWFHEAAAIDRVLLTIEPVRFGSGLPIFTGASGEPEGIFTSLGYEVRATERLNPAGTRLLTLAPG